jgi:Uma2 family endonuclease
MAIPHPTRLLTADDLEAMGSEGERKELFAGVVWDRDGAGGIHGEVTMENLVSLGTFVRAHGLGRVYPSPTHFILMRNPDTVLVADVAFLRSDRLPSEADRDRYGQVPPDFVAEVVDPVDRYERVIERIGLYRAAGVPLVWLVEPRARTVTVYTASQEPRTLREGEMLDGGDVIPGFRRPVADIFG